MLFIFVVSADVDFENFPFGSGGVFFFPDRTWWGLVADLNHLLSVHLRTFSRVLTLLEMDFVKCHVVGELFAKCS